VLKRGGREGKAYQQAQRIQNGSDLPVKRGVAKALCAEMQSTLPRGEERKFLRLRINRREGPRAEDGLRVTFREKGQPEKDE